MVSFTFLELVSLLLVLALPFPFRPLQAQLLSTCLLLFSKLMMQLSVLLLLICVLPEYPELENVLNTYDESSLGVI